MLQLALVVSAFAATSRVALAAVQAEAYNWANVKIGGGGGFVPSIVFNPSEQGLAYARTDIGGAYRLNLDDSWTPLLDFADNDDWNYWGVDAIATDPVDPGRVYAATGMYTNDWDPNNGHILVSTDRGDTWTATELPFKVGGNMPGRGMGEARTFSSRLAVDPNDNSVLFFGARSGNGLWKSSDSGSSWSQVTSLTDTGSYAPDPTDTTGYNNDILGISFVTFDSTSGSSGSATPRIFVGVANLGSTSIYMSEDAGDSWSAVEGQNTTYIPHKGILSPSENTLYVSYSNGGGPYDGTLGSVYKYNISSGVWTDITPVSGSDLYFGFGGLSVDLQKPGTVMVARGGRMGRSSAAPIAYYAYDDSLAPWIGSDYTVTDAGTLQIGWMMEGLSIDPFDSDHWLYGTGETIYGVHDLTSWDTIHNVTIESLADGIEETAIQALISPPSGPPLLSAIGDVDGFVHNSLTEAPSTSYTNPSWSTAVDIDFAGNDPTNIVRIGNGDSSSGKQVALSTDSGATWSEDYAAADNVTGGKVALSADGATILWRTSGNGVLVSQNSNSFASVSSLPSDAQIASDKVNNTVFYGASGSNFYVSTDSGSTFATAGTLGDSTSPVKIVVNANNTGDVWVSTDKGVFHTTDSGATFTQLSSVTQAWAIALGAAKASDGYPSLFTAAEIDSLVGYYRSDDEGVSWVQINDDAHGFGSASANCLTADPRIYGRVYIGTNGRGIFYGDTAA